ncbi:hypothetical protein Dimus_015770 [Dionaea muscipula]
MRSCNLIIPIESEDEVTPVETKSSKYCLVSILSSIVKIPSSYDKRNLIHSIKVGIALVMVSLLYLLDPFYEQVGENAMWAIMTVVVVLEFSTGATLGKGLNRGIGTVVGGGLGCVLVALAHAVGGIGTSIVIGVSVFLFATYARLVPCIKRRYDYGAMIFILTFNLVAVSGVRTDAVRQLARDRLSTIGMGFTVSVITSMLIFPIWASDHLHSTLASHFQILAGCLQGLLDEHQFKPSSEREYKQEASIEARCKMVLYSKSEDESLANFARWEPWHGKFGLSHPWENYLQIAEVLREIAALILSLKTCLQSPREAQSTIQKDSIKEAINAVGGMISWSLSELGERLVNMKRCKTQAFIKPKLEATTSELSQLVSTAGDSGSERFAVASFVFLLENITERVEKLAKEVEQLGELAAFDPS